ncbi:plasmid stabilization protein ParE (plasmid) [Advenella sp. S44]|uniref:type II toxin-antitoxin system RelE/ParE family toxin n=1 Tax=unclassified Advenella TaxID=2685285 RepID=UPI000C29D397|nr:MULTISPECIES: type II toxin-antitoxin system RelE/ParE family toxin [unclassified Advenella]PJX19952.1 plasmid stabilization protein ParE [Advenella sp. S44]
MLPIVWSDEADLDLDEIIAYVGQFNADAATRLWHFIVQSVEGVPDHPYMYRQSERIPGCREIVAHPNYIVVYRVEIDRIEVLRVMHSRQPYP